MEGLLKDARKAFLLEAYQRNDRKELSLEEKEGGEKAVHSSKSEILKEATGV